MWQKLRLYCACRWGRASKPTREAHAGPEPGVSALSSEGMNLIHREESGNNLLPYLRAWTCDVRLLPFQCRPQDRWPPKSQVLWPV